MATPVSLKQLAEGKSEGIQKATYFKVSPDIIKFEKSWNGRDEGADLDAYLLQLYTAMKAGAFIPPIDVEVVDGEVICRDGHCRTRAAQKLVEEGIPYMLEARQIRGNEADMVYHMVGTAAGRPLSPLEQGRVFLRLTRYGQSIAEIATRTGLNRSTIENGLALAGMPVEAQAMVSSGQVASHLALKTVRKHGKAATEKLQEAVKVAKAAGKTKATAKHVESDDGQTQKPAPLADMTQDALDRHVRYEALLALAHSLAAVNIVVSNLDRGAVVQLVQIARNLTKA